MSFYAFCRVTDDLADDLELPIEEKRAGLAKWKAVFDESEVDPELPLQDLQGEVLAVRDRYEIPSEYFTNVIEGCQMDLVPQRFERWEDLQKYTYRVASSVGLVCLPLFGADPERAHDYAIALGDALQLTNILRDIGEDLDNGSRVYVPLDDLARFDYSEEELLGRVHDARFLEFMNYQAQRCEELYDKARSLLPQEDYKALLGGDCGGSGDPRVFFAAVSDSDRIDAASAEWNYRHPDASGGELGKTIYWKACD